MWCIAYNFVLMKNDTFVSVIICYDFYHNDFDMFFVLWWRCSCMIYAHFNIVVYLWLLDANIGTPLIFALLYRGSFWIKYIICYSAFRQGI
jgi:hypothetical protein